MLTPITCLFLLLTIPAFAQDPAADPTLVGGGARSRPAYDGSASQYLEAVPVLRYWAPHVFVRSTRGPLEGGFHIEVLPGLEAGVQLAYEQGRTTSEATFLSAHDLPNIAGTAPMAPTSSGMASWVPRQSTPSCAPGRT